MSDFWLYFNMGFKYVLNINEYNHMLFLIVLTVPYIFKDWKKVLLLISLFAIGNILTLLISVYGIVTIQESAVELLIPITVLAIALYNIFTSGKSYKKGNINFIAFTVLFFGIIHGLGFSNYFKLHVNENNSDRLLPLLEFVLGIETAHIVVAFILLILSFIVQHFLRFSKRDWTLVISAFVAGIVLPVIVK